MQYALKVVLQLGVIKDSNHHQEMEFQYLFNFITFFLFLAISPLLVKQCMGSRNSNSIKKLPPGPSKLPLIGNLHQLFRGSHHTLRDLARKHGPLMHLQLGEVSAIVISSPSMAKEIYRTHDLAFVDRPKLLSWRFITYNSLDFAFISYGQYWRQMRKICVQQFFSAKSVQAFGSIRHDEFQHLVNSIRSLSGKPINLTQKIFSSVASMVSRAAFGKECKDHARFAELVKAVLSLAGGFGIADLYPSCKFLHLLCGIERKILKIRHEMDMILDNIINEHIDSLARTEEGNAQEDLIHVLLKAKDSGDLQIPIANNNIKAILFDIFAGGSETSASLVDWAMSEMIRSPDIMAKAQREVRETCKGKKTVDENDIQELRYLKLVIKETLRLHPPGPLLVPRECREDCEIGGYIIPTGTRIFVNAWAIAIDPEYWTAPDSFMPERFEDSSIDFTGSHFEYMPFGGGRRICPGITFGLANIELPLALLLYHFDWKLPPGVNSNDLDMTENNALPLVRRENLHVVATALY